MYVVLVLYMIATKFNSIYLSHLGSSPIATYAIECPKLTSLIRGQRYNCISKLVLSVMKHT